MARTKRVLGRRALEYRGGAPALCLGSWDRFHKGCPPEKRVSPEVVDGLPGHSFTLLLLSVLVRMEECLMFPPDLAKWKILGFRRWPKKCLGAARFYFPVLFFFFLSDAWLSPISRHVCFDCIFTFVVVSRLLINIFIKEHNFFPHYPHILVSAFFPLSLKKKIIGKALFYRTLSSKSKFVFSAKIKGELSWKHIELSISLISWISSWDSLVFWWKYLLVVICHANSFPNHLSRGWKGICF